jgi:hypothetical protein
METIAQEAKRLLIDIPEEEWIIGEVSDNESKCCGWGHIARIYSGNFENYHAAYLKTFNKGKRFPAKVIDVVMHFLKGKGVDHFYWIGDVNDGTCKLYPQSTPKKRVISLLDDMIAAGY